MTLTLRYRILLTLLPLLLVLIVLGTAGVVLLYRLGGGIDAILRENYDSVIAMERLNEALERIDSSFQFALSGQEEKAAEQYHSNWKPYHEALTLEQHNITLPGEGDLVDRLVHLSEKYRAQGDAFYQRPARDPARHPDYFGSSGLLDRFKEIKQVSGRILQINQDNMKDESRAAQQTAFDSAVWFGIGLAVTSVLAGLSSWHTSRTILSPIQAVTQSALAIGHGNLDQVVPVMARDELGQLADAFNTMARQLRQYRQTDYARLLRAQRNSQATIDSFPDPVLVVDSEGHVEMANPAASRVLGVVAERGKQSSALPWQPP
ncbi:MAG TPA: HAMP domain-containing protein, partial [Isosphaeraceae bacterium]|nr:HAMP domain-containing protein [Isosphaeraceae bacterium]